MNFFKKGLQYIKDHFSESFFFFLFFFGILLAVNLFHFFLTPKPSLSHALFFLFSHFGQSLVTVCCLAILCDFIKSKGPRWLHLMCIIGVFLYLFALTVESLLVLLMDVSFCEGLSIAFGADLQNFLELLYLSDLGISAWITLLIVAIATPFLAVAFYYLCKSFEQKVFVDLKREVFFKTAFLSLGFLIALDLGMTGKFSSEEIENYKKMLPWKEILIKMQEHSFPLKRTLNIKPPLQRKDLALNAVKAQSLPNIYLVISESLRGDYINPTNAPSLFAFKKTCTTFQISRSSANCTHLSWFSLFHSKYPFYWSYNKTGMFAEGSLPLNLLKEIGYSIHVYSSAQLRFYHFDEVIFGKHHHLTSTFKVFPHYGTISAAEADRAALTALMDDSLFHKKYGNVYILFLDSTHFNYSWPKDFETPFEGSSELSWLHRLSTKQQHLDTIKNRYKNSIYYVDSLFNQLSKHLKKQDLYEDSFIVFCGDHGEEFKEEGKLFHASNLNDYQTNIPLYMKLGNSQTDVVALSHIDIFPSILDALLDHPNILKAFDGTSIFQPLRPTYSISARYNASFAPYQFLLTSADAKGLFKFSNKLSVFQSKKVNSLSKLSFEEETILMDKIHEIFCQK